MHLNSICIYCGSSSGRDPSFTLCARLVGTFLAKSGRTIVYGGGNVGLMGEVADAALRARGRVIGVIPEALVARELAHRNLTRLHVVGSMHERKALMAELADGFIALPGGIGTLEELFEIWTWGQLGLHQKPLGPLNVRGFYRPLLKFLDCVVQQHLLRPENRRMIHVSADIKALVNKMSSFHPRPVPKWIKPEET